MPPRETTQLVLAGFLAVGFAAWTFSAVRSGLRRRELAALADRKRAERDADRERRKAHPEELGLRELLPDEATQAAIIALNAHELVAALQARRYTSVAVTATYIRRCMREGEALNALCEEPYASALAAARDSDARLSRAPGAGPVRQLEGLPMSLKENLHVKGLDSTCGTAVKCYQPAKEDGLQVALLRAAGAVFISHTNVPQSMMLPESDNRVWGRTSNPWDLERTPGGSSGGEAALLAARGAPLGMGGDIGGSLRIPAAFTGIYTFKCTPARVTGRGKAIPRPHVHSGQEHVHSTAGPMGRCVEDLLLVLRDIYLTSAVWDVDPTVPPVPFDTYAYSPHDPAAAPLRVGVLPTNDFFEAGPANQRAVREAAALLAGTPGVTVVDMVGRFSDGFFTDAARLYYAIMSADGQMKGFREGLEGEELLDMYKELYRFSRISNTLRPAISAALRAVGKPRPAMMVSAAGGNSAHELWDLVRQRKEWEEELRAVWRDAGIDVLLTPTTALPALRHGQSKSLTGSVSYCFAWNLPNPGYPAGTVPVTRVRPGDEEVYTAPPSQQDRFFSEAARACAGSAGLPVGVQVIAEPYRDEVALRVMRTLEEALKRERGASIEYPPDVCKAKDEEVF